MKKNLIIKDVVFWSYAILWLVSNIVSFFITKDDFAVTVTNYAFMVTMMIIVFVKTMSKKFNDWLNKSLYEKKF